MEQPSLSFTIIYSSSRFTALLENLFLSLTNPFQNIKNNKCTNHIKNRLLFRTSFVTLRQTIPLIDLTVIIVNYNVEQLLEQCLMSVIAASKEVKTEVIVVDNNSVDKSVGMVKSKFPNVKLIENKDNTGFSKANNQAVDIAIGEYILFLNPDTLVEESTFSKVLNFMKSKEDCGAVGVKMIDGTGQFLPESKRSLPTPEVAFYKIFGLARLFPKSKRFGKYHLTYLDEDENHEVDVLCGAFMCVKTSILKEHGAFDETFFMYGEDIDLSYRIQKEGYKNYYVADTKIIHYKGESTKKNSVNYVYIFYKAMVIFAQKHFTQKNAKLFSLLIHAAIYLRAGIALFRRFIKAIWLPLIEFSLILAGLYLIKYYYGEFKQESYLDWMVKWGFLAYSSIWILGTLFTGGYDKPAKIWNAIKGVLTGTIIILIGYALLNENLRFSRAFILLGSALTLIIVAVTRTLIHFSGKTSYSNKNTKKSIAIIGDELEFNRVSLLIKQTQTFNRIIGRIAPKTNTSGDKLGDFDQLHELIAIHKINELIFCSKDISSNEIIECMNILMGRKISFKIAPQESMFIVGSNSLNTPSEFYTIKLDTIVHPSNKRKKRTLDIGIAIIGLLLCPIWMIFISNRSQFLKNCFSTLFGKKSWVGYINPDNIVLPKIKPGILHSLHGINNSKGNSINLNQLDEIYAKDYNILTDLAIISRGFKKLGSS